MKIFLKTVFMFFKMILWMGNSLLVSFSYNAMGNSLLVSFSYNA